jgi:NADH:ubiquinone oxidoreductase subunit F (NADH-binding)
MTPPMTPEATALPRLLSTVGRSDLRSHVGLWGRRPVGRSSLIAEIERSRLGGRGGAGFPTAVKWAAAGSGRNPVIVANGTEGEPASNKDKTLLLHAPHLVLDGAALAAEALGASEVVVCVERQATSALRSVTHAISERIHYAQDSIPFRLEATPPGYVVGEETALVNWLNGGDAKPTFGRRPFERGVGGRPTLVNNVETLADVALIARFGSGWFAALGTEDSPGTALVTVSGDVSHPAVYEVAFGTPLADLLHPAGPTSPPHAVLVGGYAGTWLAGRSLERIRLDSRSLRASGASLGCGSIVVVGEHSCGLKAAAGIARWLAGQTAGQCGPCVHGLPAVAEAVERLVPAGAPKKWGSQIDRWLWMVDGRGACKHPDGAVRMVRSCLQAFADEVQRHRQSGDCGRPAPPLPFPRHPEVPKYSKAMV